MTGMIPKRLEIWWAELDPAMGTETRKTRPVVVISNDVINAKGVRVAIVPLLKGHKPFHYVVNVSPTAENGLDQDRRLDMTQLRFIDKTRLRGRQGSLESEGSRLVKRIQDVLCLVFFLQPVN